MVTRSASGTREGTHLIEGASWYVGTWARGARVKLARGHVGKLASWHVGEGELVQGM